MLTDARELGDYQKIVAEETSTMGCPQLHSWFP